jgi:hypothetical protein
MPRSDLLSAQQSFAAAIRDPQNRPVPAGVSRERLAIYHELFFNNFRSSLQSAYPVLSEVLAPPLWEKLIGDFFREHRCTTPEFPRMPREFLRWLAARTQAGPGEPPWIGALALWEWTELEVLLDDTTPSVEVDPQGDLLQAPIALNPSLRLHAFDYPVHRIAPDSQPEMPLDEPVYLAAYRDLAEEMAFLELNAMSAALLAMLAESPSRSGRQHIQALISSAGWKDSDILSDFAAKFLETLRHKGVVLGTKTTNTMEESS